MNKNTNNNLKTKSIKKYFWITFLVLFIITAFLYAKSQFVFLIDEIFVTGNHELTKNEVIKISKINKGENIFSVKIGETINIIKEEPYIKYAFVSRIFPNKIMINIIERKPVALIKMDEIYSFDIYGILLPKPTRTKNDLPQITGVESIYKFEFGKSSVHLQIRQGVYIIAQISNYFKNINSFISELYWDKNSKEWLILSDKYKTHIKLGDSNFAYKLQALNKYLELRKKKNRNLNSLSYIDLRFNNQLIIK
ncbi:MAG: FtsQ-type POTRA domain-containing protein [Candidatus Marinimicrobia bacterium]|nr:FtsQ-type POTRA domain-containing protein [Candidatus Neomarinimicrobiota bacterium]